MNVRVSPRAIASVVAAGAALGALSGCGASTSTSSSGIPGLNLPGASGSTAGVDACQVLTPQKAEQLTGEPMAKIAGSSVAGSGTCIYGPANGSDSVGATILLETVPGLDIQNALRLAIANEAHNSGQSQPLSGVGDVAFKQVETSSASIGFAKGSELVIISADAGSKSGASIEPALESFAKSVAGSL